MMTMFAYPLETRVALGATLLCGALGIVDPHPALAAPLSPSDRQAVLDGTLQGCNEKSNTPTRRPVCGHPILFLLRE
jgi:hypothetical protein